MNGDDGIFNVMYYESKPYLLIGLAIYALQLPSLGGYGVAAAVILLLCAGALLFARYRHRGLLR